MKTPFFLALCGSLLLTGWGQAAIPTNVVIHPDAPGGNPSAPNSATLSPSEWQELRSARMAALKANPSLVTKATQLQEKLRAFEQKLNTAMLKTDPTVAPVLSKFAGNQPAPHVIAPAVSAPKPH